VGGRVWQIQRGDLATIITKLSHDVVPMNPAPP
jgi:hypothetical protein